MIKTVIKSLLLSCREGDARELPLPLSAYGSIAPALSQDGVYFSDNMRRIDLPSGDIRLLAEPELDALTVSARVALLRIHRADTPVTASLNGTVLGTTGSEPDSVFDVTGLFNVGKNRLELTMNTENDVRTKHRASALSVGGCEIIAYNHDIINGVSTRTEQREDCVRLYLSVSTREGNGTTRAVATVVSPGGRVFYCGLMGGEGYVDITEPNLWWPNALGVQNLYKLTVNLYADSEIVDSLEMRIGLAFPTKRDEDDPTPALNVNGVPLYMRGACYMPDDALMPFCDSSRTARLVSHAQSEGMNTLVLPDLGILPEQFFFDSCSQYGISVLWQVDAERHSADELIGRISPFLPNASLMALLVTGEGREELAATLRERISGKVILTSETLSELLCEERPSVPSVRTLGSFLTDDEMNLFSDAMAYHSEANDNCELITSSLYPYPNGLEEIAYVTQMEQAFIEKCAVDRERNDKVHPSLTLFPRLNDAWPAVTKSHVDYLGEPKAQSFITRSLFAPVRISAEAEGTRVKFYVSNERKTTYRGKLTCRLLDSSFATVYDDSFDIEVADNTTVAFPELDLTERLAGHEEEYFLAYSISENMITTSKGTLLFTIPRSFKFKKPNFAVDISGSGTSFVLSISSNVFAHGVAISFKDQSAVFEDNFFDITDSAPKRIEITTERTVAPSVLRSSVTVRCAYDIGRERTTRDQI